jgi:nitrogen regulatory protein PII
MKQIIAYLNEHKLETVLLALERVEGVSGVSVIAVHGRGRSRASDLVELYDQDDDALRPKVKIELCCAAQAAEGIISAIEQSAHTGLRGDGKIYLLTIDEAVRISSGERGHRAV